MTSQDIWKLSKDILPYLYPDSKRSYIPDDLLVFTLGFLVEVNKIYSYHDNLMILRTVFYVNKKINGEYKVYDTSGHLWYKSFYVNGKLHGKYIEWNLRGNIDNQCYYKNGKLHGEYKKWNDLGNLSKFCYYKNGKLHGEYIQYHENGQIWKRCFYKNGVKRGECKVWNKDGVLDIHTIHVICYMKNN